MRKKITAAAIALTLALTPMTSVVTAFAEQETQSDVSVEDASQSTVALAESLGIRYTLTEEMKEAGLRVQISDRNAASPIGALYIYSPAMEYAAVLVAPETSISDDNIAELIAKYDTEAPAMKITASKAFGYHFIVMDSGSAVVPGEADLNGESQAEINRCRELYPQIIDSLEYVEPVEASLSFDTLNLDKEQVTDAILADYDWTIVNMWATYCNPCIQEMPDLAAWEKELPENVQILYVCTDIYDIDVNGNEIATAEKIADKAGINRKNVLYGLPGSFGQIASMVTAVPTTFFIDREGHAAPQVIVGAYIDKYKETLNDLMNTAE